MEYDRLIELILEKIHNIRGSRSLSGMLTSDLNMSKASVYRRLHGDVPFTIEELLRLVQKYGISLDELIRSGHAEGNAPHPRETLPRIVGSLDERYGFEKLVVTYICGSLPMALCAGAPALRAFAAFRSKYLSDGFKQTYEQFVQSDPAAGGSSGTLENLRAAVNSVFLLGPRLFDKLVGDLRFFEALGAVTRESAECLREEAADVLKRMGEIAVRGCYPNGNKVELYVTPLEPGGDYICFRHSEYPDYSDCFFAVSATEGLSVGNVRQAEVVRRLADGLERASTLISGCDERRLRLYQKTNLQLLKEEKENEPISTERVRQNSMAAAGLCDIKR